MDHKPLRGGFINDVTRVGDRILRTVPENSAFVHRLLGLFQTSGWAGAPSYLETDAEGHEILSYVEGVVPWDRSTSPWIVDDDALAGVARLVRQFHDLTAGSELAADKEVVCHNDLSPKNTVFRESAGTFHPVAFIDWDIAAPGQRVNDVAHICWQWLDLGPGVSDVELAARRIALIADAYGLTERSALLPTILWWQDHCWRGI
jgi:hypothetical protein